jgi:CHAT domain-containing protein
MPAAALHPSLAALLLGAALCTAQATAATGAARPAVAPPLWQAPCNQAPPPGANTTRSGDAEDLRANAPAAALRQACSRLHPERAGFDELLDVALALVALERHPAAHALLAELAPAAESAAWGPARLQLAEGRTLQSAGRTADAAARYAAALALLRSSPATPPPALVAESLTLQGTTTAVLDTSAAGLARAAAQFDEAQTLLVQGGRAASLAMSDVLNGRANLAGARGDWQAALAYARQEVQLLRQVSGPDAPSQLHALATVVSLTSSERNYDEALRWAGEARRIWQRAGGVGRRGYLGTLNTYTPMLLDLGRTQEALAVAQEAVALAREGGAASPLLLTPLERRLRVEVSLQDFLAARATITEMLELLTAHGAQVSPARQVRLLDSAAWTLAQMNDFDAAQRFIDRALPLAPSEGPMRYWHGRLLRRQATLAAAEGRWREAATLHGQALPMLGAAKGVSQQYLTGSRAMQCEAQVRAAMETTACAELPALLPALKDAAPSERVMVRRALARQQGAAGRHDEAMAHDLHALAAAQSSEAQGQLWLVLDGLATSLRATGQPELAVLLAKAAVQRIEAVRGQLALQPDMAAAYLRDKFAAYRRLADWLAEDRREHEALAVLGLLKQEEYRDFVQGRSPAPPEAPGRAAAGALPLSTAEGRWLAASPLAKDTAGPRAGPPSMDVQAAAERQQYAAWQQALRRPLARRAQGAPSANALRPGLPQPRPGEVVAALFLGPRHLNIVWRSPSAGGVLRSPVEPAALSRDIGRLLEQLQHRQDAHALLRALYATVAAPLDRVAQQASATHWTLNLDGDLRYLPFAALHDGRGHLVQRISVQQRVLRAPPIAAPMAGAASASAAAAAAGDAPSSVSGPAQPVWLRAFGTSQAHAGLPALPGVTEEVCAIVQGPVQGTAGAAPCQRRRQGPGAVPGQGWLDQAFTKARLQAAAASGSPERQDLLHIGTHFVLRPGEVGRSWLLLGDGQRLALDEMLSWRLASQDLVTLSACQTGVGGGAEIEGLSTLILARGAGAVLASLWSVDDSSTARLLRDMYAAQAAGLPTAAALRQAQLTALRHPEAAQRHPHHWAAFGLSSAR